jgi:hypothetical protein
MGNSGGTYDPSMPNQTIPILKEAHASTALILVGAQYLTSSTLPTWRQIWAAYRDAGLSVAMEWNMEGGWGRLYDMNPQVYQYAQTHPSQNWAFAVDTYINTSDLPQGVAVEPNHTIIVPLEQGIQAYVYQYYSASNFTWLYNESSIASKGGCVGPVLQYSCYTQEKGTQVDYGAYTVFYNSTGLYASIHSNIGRKLTYNLYWISFQYYDGKLQWPSLFYAQSFDTWMESWQSWLQNVSGYVNYEYQDNSGFPSTDYNPGIIQYLENTYNFTFNFEGWSHSATGTITKSQFFINYENYRLIDLFSQAKQQLAHKYGVQVVLDVSDMKYGVPWEWGYSDGYVSWFDPSSTNEIVCLFQGWAGPGFYTNTSMAIAASDWIPSPSGLTANLVEEYMSNLTLWSAMCRPEATFFVWYLQFPTSQISGPALQALAHWDTIFEESDAYGRFISNIGMQRYTYINFLTAYNGSFLSDPYVHFVLQAPLEYSHVDVGDTWLSYLGSGGQPVINLTDFNDTTALLGGWADYGTNGLTLIPALDKDIRGQLGLHNFYVNNEWNTYVFQYGQLYYVLLDNYYVEARSVPFIYHDLNGYIAVNLSSGQQVFNDSTANLAPNGGQQLILLEPANQTGLSLLYTNATSFSYNSSANQITLVNPIPATSVLTLQSSYNITSLAVNLSTGQTYILPVADSSTVSVQSFSGKYLYLVTIPYQFTWAKITVLTSTSTQSTSTQSTSTQSTSTQSTSTQSQTSFTRTKNTSYGSGSSYTTNKPQATVSNNLLPRSPEALVALSLLIIIVVLGVYAVKLRDRGT